MLVLHPCCDSYPEFFFPVARSAKTLRTHLLSLLSFPPLLWPDNSGETEEDRYARQVQECCVVQSSLLESGQVENGIKPCLEHLKSESRDVLMDGGEFQKETEISLEGLWSV